MQNFNALLVADDSAPVQLSRQHNLDSAPHSDGAPAAKRERPSKLRHTPTAKAVTADAILKAFNTWAFKREQPSDPELLFQTVSDALALGEPIPFVLYWGKGPRCRLAEPDTACLDYLSALTARIHEVYAPGATIRLIFTDTHAELNGHTEALIRAYFADVKAVAHERGFETCLLSELTRAAEAVFGDDPNDRIVPGETLDRLCVSAMKWYRGDGTAEEGALKYYRMNMIEKRAVELAFPRSIFITFNGSDLRSLFPDRLPIFYMYSLRRGFSVKPWFLPTDAAACDVSVCHCAASQA